MGKLREHSVAIRKKCEDLNKSGNEYKKKKTLKFKNFKTILNWTGKGYKATLSGAKVRRMVREVKKDLRFKINLNHLGVTVSPGTLDITSMLKDCLKGKSFHHKPKCLRFARRCGQTKTELFDFKCSRWVWFGNEDG